MKNWNLVASEPKVRGLMRQLIEKGIACDFVPDALSAKEKVFELMPENSEVMTMTSITLETIGVTKEIQDSSRFVSVKKRLMSMNRKTQGLEMQRVGAAPDYALGSVHAITEAGELFIASQSGSQLPAYAYGASHVIWVVGTQKIVKDSDEAIKRIYEHCLPLESERARQAYGVAGSSVNKILRINKENQQGRINIIFVNEALGF